MSPPPKFTRLHTLLCSHSFVLFLFFFSQIRQLRNDPEGSANEGAGVQALAVELSQSCPNRSYFLCSRKKPGCGWAAPVTGEEMIASQPHWLERAPALHRAASRALPRLPGELPHRRQSEAPGSWLDLCGSSPASGSQGPLQPGETAKGVCSNSSSSSSSSSRRSAAKGAPASLAHPSLLRMPLPSSSRLPGLTVGIHGMTHADRTPAATYCSGVPSLLCYPLCVVQRELLLGELLDVEGNC